MAGKSNHCYFAVTTTDVLTANNNDVSLIETQTVHFA